jgi:hypothetical protein
MRPPDEVSEAGDELRRVGLVGLEIMDVGEEGKRGLDVSLLELAGRSAAH